MEAYSQNENQSIRSFYTEVLKLFEEADSDMSEATKLKIFPPSMIKSFWVRILSISRNLIVGKNPERVRAIDTVLGRNSNNTISRNTC